MLEVQRQNQIKSKLDISVDMVHLKAKFNGKFEIALLELCRQNGKQILKIYNLFSFGGVGWF